MHFNQEFVAEETAEWIVFYQSYFDLQCWDIGSSSGTPLFCLCDVSHNAPLIFNSDSLRDGVGKKKETVCKENLGINDMSIKATMWKILNAWNVPERVKLHGKCTQTKSHEWTQISSTVSTPKTLITCVELLHPILPKDEATKVDSW